MLENFESYSFDGDYWKSLRNVIEDYRHYLAVTIIASARAFTGERLTVQELARNGELIHFPGSDLTHFVYDGHPLLAWTAPVIEQVGVTRVHMTWKMGTLQPVTEETRKKILYD